MKIVSTLHDGRINATNHLAEMTTNEYLSIAKKILRNNTFQRKKIRSSNTVYSLLKEDYKKGCILPPIVLGINTETPSIEGEKILDTINQNTESTLILDGLQRTYSLIDLEQELDADKSALNEFHDSILRIEIYTSINRIGILYRMLTLNTGQSPMSIRQQIEMLYSDYTNKPLEGITLIRETDEESPKKIGDYTFKSVADGFNSYIERSELPIDRTDLLENIKGLEKLSSEDSSSKLFESFIKTYNSFTKKYNELLGEVKFTAEELEFSAQPFGTSALRIFSKSQPLTGFGAAMGKLRDINQANTFESAALAINTLSHSKDMKDTTERLLDNLEKIRMHSKKIGNAQRLFFTYYFRELFNPESESYCDLSKATEEAYRKYETQVM